MEIALLSGDALLGVGAAFGLTALLLPVCERHAHRLGGIVAPRPDRLSRRTVPTLGGLAIAAGIGAGLLMQPSFGADFLVLLAALATMVALGLAVDLRSVPPPLRISFEAGIGVAFTLAVTGTVDPSLRLVAVILAAVAVPVAVNATNLVDNADGLAATMSLITAVALAGIAITAGLAGTSAAALSLVLAAGCVGFLVFNAPPARIFMGDTGSLMLGFMLAAASILLVRDSLALTDYRHLSIGAAVMLAWAPQGGDLAMVFVTRFRRGDPPFEGSVDHTSHRLLAAGLGPWQVLGVIALVATVTASAAVYAIAAFGDFRSVAAITVAGFVLVGLFETIVARTVPCPRRQISLGGYDPAMHERDKGYTFSRSEDSH